MDSTRSRLTRWRAIFVSALVFVVAGVVVGIALARPPLWLILGVIAAALALAVMVVIHARLTRYRCPDCGEVFRISSVTDFISPHYPHKKLLRCPKCSVTAWCEETK